MSDLYDQDILLWSERQAAQLRRLAADARVNDADLDWENIIEEIEGVGNGELRAVESNLIRALIHALKIRGWHATPYVSHWRAEVRGFRGRCDGSLHAVHAAPD